MRRGLGLKARYSDMSVFLFPAITCLSDEKKYQASLSLVYLRLSSPFQAREAKAFPPEPYRPAAVDRSVGGMARRILYQYKLPILPVKVFFELFSDTRQIRSGDVNISV